jgi:hypothetical protein
VRVDVPDGMDQPHGGLTAIDDGDAFEQGAFLLTRSEAG